MKNKLRYIGPGLVVAATGIGAGDMIAATVGGSSFGYTILWAVVIGAILKFILNEGIGRWQLSTRQSIPEAWITKLPSFFSWYFIIYLIFWSFIVAAALIAATGLAAHSLWPVLSVTQWGIIHSLLALVFVLWGNYSYFEKVMKIMIALLFIVVIISVVIIAPDLSGVLSGLFIPQIQEGSASYVMAIIGGVGGSVTLLSYGYWIAEKKWKGRNQISRIRIDLAAAYILTGIFGIAIVILAANLEPEIVKSNKIIIALANEMKTATGEIGSWIFLLGFWGAVTSSMLGVWQGVPYLFADFISTWRKENVVITKLHKSKYYISFLFFLAIPPIIILYFQKPVWLIMAYSVIGAFFMPFLAITLFWLNNKRVWVNKDRNSILINIFLVLILCLFVYLASVQLISIF